MSITTRAGKGAPLTNDELDANFTTLVATDASILAIAEAKQDPILAGSNIFISPDGKTINSVGSGGATPIINDLTTGGTGSALSAQQGVVIKSITDGLAGEISGFVAGPPNSSAGEMVLFTDTTGKNIQRSNSIFGFLQATAGIITALSAVALKTALNLVKGDVGLSSVDNTPDTAKPISVAQQALFDTKAPLASPNFTGTPASPTAAPGLNTNQLATMAALVNERSTTSALSNKAISGLSNTLTNVPGAAITGIIPISHLATGTPTGALFIRDDGVLAPAGGGGGGGDALTTNPLSQFATTTSAQLASIISDETGTGALVFAASPALTGVPIAPTAAAATNSTQVATTAHVFAERSNTSTLTGKTIDGGSNTLTNLPAANISGVIAISHLATGTPTGSKFIRDDGTLQAIAGGGDALTTSPLSQFSATTSAQLAGVISDETGTGALVFAGSPALTGTPTVPTAAAGTNTTQAASTAHVLAERTNAATLTGKTISGASNTLTNLPAANISGIIPMANLASGTPTGSKFIRDDGTLQAISGGGDAFVANPLSQFAATTSAQLAGIISDETGSGKLVFATSPSFVGPITAPGSIITAPATATTIIDWTKGENDFALTTAPTLTLAAGTLSTGQSTVLKFTGDTVDRIVTLPAGTWFSLAKQAAITTFTVPAGKVYYIPVIKTAAGWDVIGEPEPATDRSWSRTQTVGANGTVTMTGFAAAAGIIKAIYGKTVSGTISVAVSINGTAVTGASCSAASTRATGAATAVNVVAVGDIIAITYSSNAAAVSTDVTVVWTPSSL